MKKALITAVVAGLVSSSAWSAKFTMPLPQGTRIITVGKNSVVKTIEDAIRRVERIRNGGSSKPLAICIDPGDYFLKKPIVINRHHSSTNMAPFFICGTDLAKRPRIHCGVQVTGWKKETFNGCKDVWSANVANLDIPERPKILSFNGKQMQPARYPNFDHDHPFTNFAISEKAGPDEHNRHSDEIWVQEDDFRTWKNPEDGWATVGCPWNFGYSTMAIVSSSTNVIRMKADHKLQSNWKSTWDRWYVEHIAEELDAPGEWYYDCRKKKVYLLTPDGSDPSKALVTIATFGPALKMGGAGNCTIAGLEITDSTTDGIRIEASYHVNVHACTVHEVQKSGIWVQGCNLKVTDCDIYRTGHGIFIHNGCGNCWNVDGRMNLDVDNNYIHHCTSGGIWMWGQGVRLRHNLIHDMPRHAIYGFGRFCEISYNHLRHVHYLTDDGGAIYDNRWSNGVGTHICYNKITDVIGNMSVGHGNYIFNYGAVGIYMDECSGGLTVYGNLVKGSHLAGMHLHNGRWATISNNVFVSNGGVPANIYTYQLSIQTWDRNGFQGSRRDDYVGEYKAVVKGDPRWKKFPSMAQDPGTDEGFSDNDTMIMGVKVFNNIFYYPDQWAGHMLVAPKLNTSTNFFNRNVYWPGNEYRSRVLMSVGMKLNNGETNWEAWQRRAGQDKDSKIANPGFIDAKRGDYRLKSGSIAFRLGFKELPYDKMGLEKTFFRPELPKEAEGLREHPEWLLRKKEKGGKAKNAKKYAKKDVKKKNKRP